MTNHIFNHILENMMAIQYLAFRFYDTIIIGGFLAKKLGYWSKCKRHEKDKIVH